MYFFSSEKYSPKNRLQGPTGVEAFAEKPILMT